MNILLFECDKTTVLLYENHLSSYCLNSVKHDY